MTSSVIQSYEIGREASRQAKEDAYTAARRPIVNAYADRAAQQQLASGEQTMNLRDSAEGRATAAEGRAAQDQDNGQTDRQFKMAAQFTDALSQQLQAAPPGTKPSDLLKGVPPEVLKAIQLDTPDAQAHFAQIYDADPTQLTAHSQMYGGQGQKVKTSVAVTADDGTEGFLQTFDNGKTHFVPGYKAKPSGASGAFTIGDTRYDAAGNEIVQDTGAVQRAAAARGQGGAFGTAQGKTQAEDIPISDSAARSLAGALVGERQKQATYERSADQAKKLINGLSTGYAANLNIPGSPAYQLAQALAPLEAGATFEGLADLKKASKTGASGLGALSDKEGELLRTLKGSLAAGQDQSVIRANLDAFLEAHRQRIKAQEQAYLDNVGLSVDEGLHKGSRAPAAAAGGDDLADLRAKYGGK